MNQHRTRPDDPKTLDFFQSNKIIVGNSEVHGRGVFATSSIKEKELIERCPLVLMEYRSKYQLDPQIFNYMYAEPPCPCEDCQKHGFRIHLVLGYGMIYNHQDNPNALWKFNYTQLFADVIAIKDIAENQEIFVSYGNQYFFDKPKVDIYNAKNN